MRTHPPFKPCPCGSKRSFQACCGPLLAGQPAQTAEQLMRSRYTAYVLHDVSHLLQTWHVSTRPTVLDLSTDPAQWESLKIHRTEGGHPEDTTGVVEFTAKYKAQGQKHQLHETSRFLKVKGHWQYLEGEVS